MKHKMIGLTAALALLLQMPAFPTGAADAQIYEAEDAVMTGGLESISETGASGGQVVGKFSESEDVLTFSVEIPANGSYDLIFNSMGYGGDKTNKVSIDGEYIGTFVTKAEEYNDAVLSKVVLTAGKHEIAITKSWGWIAVDYLKIQVAEAIPDSVYQVSDVLIDPDAIPETKALFSYLCEGYGKQVIAGQVADNGLQGDEFKSIYEVTGKYPAMLGLDMMSYSLARQEMGGNPKVVETALDFAENGGIVTFCWHWNAPNKYLKSGNDEENGNPRWWGGFYTRNSTFDIEAVMNGDDPEGKKLLDADIAEIAKQMNRLEEAGVPVLWRPLHEASGGWFWWGAKGAEPYKALYKYLHDQLTNTYGCHNLIWVWNGQNPDWYPGDEYVDIIGEDLYLDKHVYSASAAKFYEILEYSGGKKMIALTENGVVFDIDNVIAAGTKWAWFNTWNKEFITKNGVFSDEYTEAHILKKTYQSEYVITLDELPDWDTYTPDSTEPTEPETVKGDVNADGTFNLTDVVAMQKWLLCAPDAAFADWQAGDLCADEKIDAFDLAIMKRKLLSKS